MLTTHHICKMIATFSSLRVSLRRISLGVVAFHANTERFQGLVPLLLHLCPLSVPKGGGGVCGVYSESP